MKKSRTKVFFGGLVIGLLVGAILGGFAIACVGGTAFVNFELSKHSVIMPTIIK